MPKSPIYLIAITLFLLSPACAPVFGQSATPAPPGRDPVIEQEISTRLGAINVEAVPPFEQATRDMDAGNLAAARQGYEQVLQLVPDFPDALRRLSYILAGLGDTQAGVDYARAALKAQDAPFNHMALAQALLATQDVRQYAESLTEAQIAAQALPDDVQAQFLLMMSGALNDRTDIVRQVSQTVIALQPDYAPGHFFAGLAAAQAGEWEKAERELLLSQKLGMPAEQVQGLLNQGVTRQALIQRTIRWGAYTAGGWLAGLVGLFLGGLVLSQLTLAAVNHYQPALDYRVSVAERFTRTLYRVVIVLTSIYFYLSVPFVILLVVGGAATVIYGFFLIGSIPIQIGAIIGVGTLYSLIAILRGVFTRFKASEPGRPLTRGEAPQLWLVAESVARRLGTRPVDAIYITPAPEIAVIERGNLLKILRGEGQRCLILGLGALAGLTQGQFQAILAHEYGHFNNRDTAGGNLAGQVQASLYHIAYRLAATGQAQWFNPAWLFVNTYQRIFLRIALGASRLQEILADRYAALAYGVSNFSEGLRHIVRQTLTFNAQVNREVSVAVDLRRGLSNLYTLVEPLPEVLQTKLSTQIDDAFKRPTSPYDSHPAVQTRLQLVEQLRASGPIADDNIPTSVWDLLPNAEALQSEMTAKVMENVRRRQR